MSCETCLRVYALETCLEIEVWTSAKTRLRCQGGRPIGGRSGFGGALGQAT